MESRIQVEWGLFFFLKNIPVFVLDSSGSENQTQFQFQL
jgi:hypothetical protein